MLGVSWQSVLDIANTVYLVALTLSVLFTFLVIYASSQVTQQKDQQLRQFQITSGERVAGLEAETEKAKAQQAELSVQLEKERIKRIELEAALAPRTLLPKQQEEFTLALSGAPGKITVFHFSDAETTNFADLIMTAIERAGLSVSVVPSQMMRGSLPRGVIFQPSPKAPATLNDAIRTALSAADIPFAEKPFRPIPNIPQEQPIILVGAKP